MAEALAALSCDMRALTPPATLDGGDVLQLPGSRHILVGLSKRTNSAAVEQMQALLGPQRSVHGVRVDRGLHLKSVLTALDCRTLLFADNEAGRSLSAALAAHPALAGPAAAQAAAGQQEEGAARGWEHVFVPDPICANVLLVGRHVVMQVGWRRTSSVSCLPFCCAPSQQFFERGG